MATLSVSAACAVPTFAAASSMGAVWTKEEVSTGVSVQSRKNCQSK